MRVRQGFFYTAPPLAFGPRCHLDLNLLIFLALVLFGSYVQTVAGFALGMILIAGSSGLALFPLPVTTAVISLVSMVNIFMALHGHYPRIYRRGVIWLIFGQLPFVALGVALLNYLDASAERVLQGLLGSFILLGCGAMMIRPKPQKAVSGRPAFFAAGVGGGLLGGLFSASGPVIGWFVYRQPLAVPEIRASLLAAFAIGTMARTLVVAVEGGLTRDVWALAAWSIPLVLLATWLGRRFPPALSEISLRRLAFTLLFAMGGWILLLAIRGPGL